MISFSRKTLHPHLSPSHVLINLKQDISGVSDLEDILVEHRWQHLSLYIIGYIVWAIYPRSPTPPLPGREAWTAATCWRRRSSSSTTPTNPTLTTLRASAGRMDVWPKLQKRRWGGETINIINNINNQYQHQQQHQHHYPSDGTTMGEREGCQDHAGLGDLDLELVSNAPGGNSGSRGS